MTILCDKCAHKTVCARTKDFEHIINRIDTVGLIQSTKVSEAKHIGDFEWFSYTPHCKYFLKQEAFIGR